MYLGQTATDPNATATSVPATVPQTQSSGIPMLPLLMGGAGLLLVIMALSGKKKHHGRRGPPIERDFYR